MPKPKPWTPRLILVAARRETAMSQAFLATQFLHEVSETLYQMRNNQNRINRPSVPVPTEKIAVPDPTIFKVYHVDCPEIFPGTKWDHQWLTLVCHCFSIPQWPSDAAQGPPISFMEVLLDLLITFQVTTPLNKKNMKQKHGHCTHLPWEQIRFTNYLPSKEESSLSPPPLLTECHSSWMNTLEFLKPLVNLCTRISRRPLAHVGYSNMLPSWPSRPLLLSGDSASPYLSSVIKPRARTLKYRCIVPKAKPRPLAPALSEILNESATIRCIAPLTQLRWGGARTSRHDIQSARATVLKKDPCPLDVYDSMNLATPWAQISGWFGSPPPARCQP